MRGQITNDSHRKEIDALSKDLDFPLKSIMYFFIAFVKKCPI